MVWLDKLLGRPSVKRLTRDEASSLVCSALNGRIGHVNGLSVWIGGNYDQASWEPKLRAIEEQIKSVRAWAKANTSGVVLAEYLQWLKYYYQHGVDEARKELHTHATQKSQLAFSKRLRSNSEMITRNLSQFPKPPSKLV